MENLSEKKLLIHFILDRNRGKIKLDLLLFILCSAWSEICYFNVFVYVDLPLSPRSESKVFVIVFPNNLKSLLARRFPLNLNADVGNLGQNFPPAVASYFTIIFSFFWGGGGLEGQEKTVIFAFFLKKWSVFLVECASYL